MSYRRLYKRSARRSSPSNDHRCVEIMPVRSGKNVIDVSRRNLRDDGGAVFAVYVRNDFEALRQLSEILLPRPVHGKDPDGMRQNIIFHSVLCNIEQNGDHEAVQTGSRVPLGLYIIDERII